ncbi:phosphotransferase enzyme family protein [Colletotrichum orchidophilum]|uniref:Phosphotransferase enzyme family protein n=1 Tax=Colletotrichum orchidophilum TaxID=1209926 RepID=A0A1G4BF17_9PEZI|nr:phosphotransferase enzyme family protein [Colletotrichum orchidophilum]OHE99946.1 phosphotransferase enzyme family protein [Colletotrichum orchidophilum]
MSTTDTSTPIISFNEFSVPGQMKIFPESSFLKQRRAPRLPAPAKVRAYNEESDIIRTTSFDRPLPIIFLSLGLLINYGNNFTILKTLTQKIVSLYISLIEGVTLQERWCNKNEDERRAICKELKKMAKALRALEQDKHDRFFWRLGKQLLNDIFLAYRPDLRGPFVGLNAVQQFQDACGIEIDSEVPIVFTHDDLVLPNVILSLGRNPKVAAIIDWG